MKTTEYQRSMLGKQTSTLINQFIYNNIFLEFFGQEINTSFSTIYLATMMRF